MALEKKELDNFLPNGFETLNQEGYKEDFSEDKIQTGYEKDVPDLVSGPNINNFIDKVGKNFNVLDGVNKYLNNMPINSIPTVNANNQLDYVDNNFLNKTQLTNCILSAPNGVATYSGNTITVKQGLKNLISDGRNIDKTLKNIEYTVANDINYTVPNGTGTFILELLATGVVSSHIYNSYYVSKEQPTGFTAQNAVWYNTEENTVSITTNTGSSWSVSPRSFLGIFVIEDGQVTSFEPFQPVELLKRSDLSNYIVAQSSPDILPDWWVEYADGKIEQGGRKASKTQKGEITYLRPYKSVILNILSNIESDSPTTHQIGLYSLEESKLKKLNYSLIAPNVATGFDWKVIGY